MRDVVTEHKLYVRMFMNLIIDSTTKTYPTLSHMILGQRHSQAGHHLNKSKFAMKKFILCIHFRHPSQHNANYMLHPHPHPHPLLACLLIFPQTPTSTTTNIYLYFGLMFNQLPLLNPSTTPLTASAV